MEQFIATLKGSIATVLFTIGSVFAPAPTPQVIPFDSTILDAQIQYLNNKVSELEAESEKFGATFVTPDTRALFSTTLASKITSSATSMTLSSATDEDGNTLASSTYGFIIDEGTSAEEMVLADCTGTTCTNMTRGISVATATTSVAALQFEHRRGASVKITTAPSVVFALNVLKGRQNIENVLQYSSSIATTTIDNDVRNLVNYDLLTYTAFNGAGVIDATSASKGVVELATQIETASSTATGGSGPLAVPASNATSTYNSATAALRVVVTKNDGKIDANFFPSTIPTTSGTNTWTGSNTFATSSTATTTIGAFPAWEIGKHRKVFTVSGTFTVPTGISRVCAKVVGGGGGGGGNTSAGATSGGGGGGGYADGCYNVTATTTVGVTVGASGAAGAGAGGTGGTGGTSYFSTFANATGGTGGDTQAGGTGGVGSGGDFNVKGAGGGGVAAANATGGGTGGSSVLGGGGNSVTSDASDRTGSTGGNYGGGGGGAHAGSGGDTEGGAGAAGIVIVNW